MKLTNALVVKKILSIVILGLIWCNTSYSSNFKYECTIPKIPTVNYADIVFNFENNIVTLKTGTDKGSVLRTFKISYDLFNDIVLLDFLYVHASSVDGSLMFKFRGKDLLVTLNENTFVFKCDSDEIELNKFLNDKNNIKKKKICNDLLSIKSNKQEIDNCFIKMKSYSFYSEYMSSPINHRGIAYYLSGGNKDFGSFIESFKSYRVFETKAVISKKSLNPVVGIFGSVDKEFRCFVANHNGVLTRLAYIVYCRSE